jgi:hypothetical protein
MHGFNLTEMAPTIPGASGPMTALIIAVLTFALAVAVLALCREVRLRKALQRLLQLLLSRWRAHVSKSQTFNRDSVDRTAHPHERL